MTDQAQTIHQESAAVAEDLRAIAEVVQRYFDGIHLGDVTRLEQVFHPDAQLIGEVNGEHYQKHRSQYIGIVRNRPAPASSGAEFRMRILGIDLSYHTAVAKLFTPVGTNEYVDFLSLQKIDGTWVVVHKLFSNEVPAAKDTA